MDDQLYREIILENWKNPQNYGILESADIDIKDYNPLCGDTIRITAKLKDRSIKEIKFIGEGCAISKASGSILTEVVENMKIEDIQKMSAEDFLKNLEITLTVARLKCALLSYSALQKSLTLRMKKE